MESLDSIVINSAASKLKTKEVTTTTTTVIKVTNKYLHEKGIGVMNNSIYEVQEDILREANILNILTSSQDAPKSIVKYRSFFKRYNI